MASSPRSEAGDRAALGLAERGDELGLRERRRSSLRSRVVDAGAAPHEQRRSAERSRSRDARARRRSPPTARARRSSDDTRSRSSRSTIADRVEAAGRGEHGGGRPREVEAEPGRRPRCGTAAPRTARPGRRATPACTMLLNACSSRLRWVSTAPLGRPVVPEVYMMNAGALVVDGGLDGCRRAPRRAGRRGPLADRQHGAGPPGVRPAAATTGANASSTTTAVGAGVGERVGDLVGDQPEVHRHADRARRAARRPSPRAAARC